MKKIILPLVLMLTAMLTVVCQAAPAPDADSSAGFLVTVMDFLRTYWVPISSVIGTAAAIAAATPTTRDDTIVGVISRVFDFLGANIGAAQNANKPKSRKRG